MKTSAILIAATAAIVTANNPGSVPYSCAKANANYCLGGDIILRCDGNSVGTPGRCSDNLSGYPPAGGVASCWESAEQAGDAACVKNCIVHADPNFTLPETECTPSVPITNSTTTITTTSIAATTTKPPGNFTTITSTLTQPPGTWYPNTTCTSQGFSITTITTIPGAPLPSVTVVVPPPSGTVIVPPPSGTVVPVPGPGNGTGNGNGTSTWTTGAPGGPGGPGGSGSPTTKVPVGPTTTAGSGTVPTGAAAINRAGSFLAAAGLVAAYLI